VEATVAKRKVHKQPYWIGEVIMDDAEETYEVTAVIEFKGWDFWRVEIVSKKDGHQGSFDATVPSKYWQVIKPSIQRVWNL